MKKYIYLLFIVSCLCSTTKAQVLWSEDFDNYTIGNLGIIHSSSGGQNVNPNPPVPGQGGWYVTEVYSNSGSYTNYYDIKIEPETGRGNVLNVKDIPRNNTSYAAIHISKVVEDGTLWNGRNFGNNILKFEYDFYTGNLATKKDIKLASVYLNKAKNIVYNSPISGIDITPLAATFYYNTENTNIIRQLSLHNTGRFGELSDNTWVTLVIYIDYTSGYVYLEMPSINISIRSIQPLLGTSDGFEFANHIDLSLQIQPNVFTDNSNRNSYFVKFDNLKMSAVNTLPLSLKKLAATKFTIFPNPITDFVTITNSDNIGVKQIEVFEISGKIVKTQTFNNENEVQLSLADLVSGTYLMHIKTNVGTAIEKVIKK